MAIYKMLVFFLLLTSSFISQSQAIRANAESDNSGLSWFGIIHPPGFKAHDLPVIISGRGPRPMLAPKEETHFEHLRGGEIKKDLISIVNFSKQSRITKEIGSGQLWGRLSGFSSGANTINWALRKFKEAGIENTALQAFDQDEKSKFWIPLNCQLTLLANRKFGEKTQDIVLESAMPLSPSTIPEGRPNASLVYVGAASTAELNNITVKGKIAVQRIIPQGHLVFERRPAVPRAQELFSRGVVAVINIIQQADNERAIDFRNCGGPCFNFFGGRKIRKCFIEGT